MESLSNLKVTKPRFVTFLEMKQLQPGDRCFVEIAMASSSLANTSSRSTRPPHNSDPASRSNASAPPFESSSYASISDNPRSLPFPKGKTCEVEGPAVRRV